MTMLRKTGLWAVTAFVFASMSPRVVIAQTTTPTGQTAQGPLVVERIHSRFVIAPDFKVTEVDDEVAGLAGAYGGWLNDRTLLIGAGGYWLANRHDDFKMAYGGLVVGWQMAADRRIGFGVRGLVGAGEATLGDSVTILTRDEPFARFGQSGRNTAVFPPINRRFIFDEGFFIAEPQVDLHLRFTNSIRLNWGVGYRLIGAARGVEDRLRGVTGSVAIQFGG